MAQTAVYGLHYPALSDAPNVPQWVQDLAEDVEAEIERVDANFALKTQLPVWIHKSATESVANSTALQNDDHFAFPVAANAIYALEGFVMFDAPDTVDINCAFTVPAAATFAWANFSNSGPDQDATATGVINYNTVVQAAAVARKINTLANGVATLSMQPKGTLVTGANAGTLQFQWGPVVSNATATRVLINSWMKLTRIV